MNKIEAVFFGVGKNICYECLLKLASLQSNANARNYFLNQAIEMQGGSMEFDVQRPLSIVHAIPLQSIFEGLTVRTEAEKCLDYNKKVLFHFIDIDEKWTVWVRNDVTEIQPFLVSLLWINDLFGIVGL